MKAGAKSVCWAPPATYMGMTTTIMVRPRATRRAALMISARRMDPAMVFPPLLQGACDGFEFRGFVHDGFRQAIGPKVEGAGLAALQVFSRLLGLHGSHHLFGDFLHYIPGRTLRRRQHQRGAISDAVAHLF